MQSPYLVYDPGICVDHFCASRPNIPDLDFVYMANHNLTFVLARDFRSWQRLAFIAYTFLWGDFPEMGLAVFARTYLQRLWRCRDWRFIHYLRASFRGKLDALRALRSDEQMDGLSPA